jgi:hypothetical protein
LSAAIPAGATWRAFGNEGLGKKTEGEALRHRPYRQAISSSSMM